MPGLVEIVHEPTEPLAAPVLVAAFDGWIDAAGAATAAVSRVSEGGTLLARFDGDALFDYRSRRPVLDVVEGTLHQLTWPELTVTLVRPGERDLLVLNGAEPDYRWRELGQSVLELVLHLGVVEWVSVGAIPAAVPHTRPIPIHATESQPGLLRDGADRIEGVLRVPSAALSVVELTVSGSGIPAVGFYAQVPHYVSGPFAAGAIALLERLERDLGVPISLGELAEEAVAQRSRIDQLLADQPESQAYVRQLELSADDEERVPSGEELAAEIERFLRESGGDAGTPPRER